MARIHSELIYGKYYQQFMRDGVAVGNPSEFVRASRESVLDKTGVKRKKPSVYMPPTAFSVSKLVYQNVRGEHMEYGSQPNERYYIYGVMGPTPSYSVPARSSARKQRAEVKALLALKDQSVNLGMAFATANQTAQLLGTAGRRIANMVEALRSAKKLDFRRAANSAVRGIPQALLENQYGWRPLLSDVKGSLDKVKDDALNAGFMVTVRGEDTERFNGSQVLYPGTVAQMRESKTSYAGCKVRLDYMPENPLLIQLNSLGLTNPAVVAWDLVPYSFIVDWCLPIGDWLNSLDAALGYQFLGGTYTYKEYAEYKYSKFADGAPQLEWARGGGWSRAKEISRGVYSSSPLPRPPSPRNPLKSITHMWEGLALLQRAFR